MPDRRLNETSEEDAHLDEEAWPDETGTAGPVAWAPTHEEGYLPTDVGDEIHPEDADDEWRSGPPKRGIRVAVPTAILGVLALLGVGFWGGAVAERHHNPPASSALSSLANRFAGRGAAGGGGGAGGAGSAGSGAGRPGTGAGGFGGGGASGAATEGIVTGVQGNTLYVTDAQGNLVKVTPGPSASITQASPTPLSGLTTGNTVVVRGTTNADGSVTATAISSTPAGG